jgi:hypothetical protein
VNARVIVPVFWFELVAAELVWLKSTSTAAIAELVQASQQATAARSPSHNRGRRRSQLGRFTKRGPISA